MLNPRRMKHPNQSLMLNGSMFRYIILVIILVGTLFGSPHRGEGYEWMDHIQDQTSIQIPMDILRHPMSELPEIGPSGYSRRLETNWFLRKRYVAVGDRKVGAMFLDRVYEQMIDLGAFRMRTYTMSLLREAFTLSKLGYFDEALLLCEDASKFSPGIPEPHKASAQIYLMQSKLNIIKASMEWFRAARASVMNFGHLILILINLNLLFLITCLVFFGIFYLVQFTRYYRLVHHDLYEILPGDPHLFWVAGTALLFMIIPLLFGLGLYTLCLFWILFLWSYGGRKERVVHILFLLFTAVVPFWIGTLQHGVEVLHNDRIQALIRHQDGLSDDSSISMLTRLTAQSDADDTLDFVLGTAYKKQGEYKKAEKAFKKAITMNPGEAIYYNNLGNTYFASRDFKRAIEMYSKAIELDPKRASSYFNMSATYREQFMLNKSDQEFYKARELDTNLVSYYVDIIGPSFNRMVIDETLSERRLWADFFKQLFPNLWKFDWGRSSLLTSSSYWLVPVALLLALLPLHYFRRLLGIARHCKKCGIIYCKKCQSVVRSDSVCSQCVYIFEEQSGVDVKQRTKKIIEIRKYIDQRRETGKWLGILLPGGGHIYFGMMFRGFAVLFIVVSCLMYGFFWDVLILDFVTFQSGNWIYRLWVMIPALFIYGLSINRLSRFRG